MFPLLFFLIFTSATTASANPSLDPLVWPLNFSITLNPNAAHFSNWTASPDFPTRLDYLSTFFDPNWFAAPNHSALVHTAFPCFISSSSSSYTFCICLSNAQLSFDDFAVSFSGSTTPRVWCANRNQPARGNLVYLTLQRDGNLILQGDADEKPVWSTGTAEMDVARMELSQFPVNLILYDSNNATVWQSIDHLTDTLTIGQVLKPGMKLVSWASIADPSEGNFSLVLDSSGSLTLECSFPAPGPYWTQSQALCPGMPECSDVTAYIDAVGFALGNLSVNGSLIFFFENTNAEATASFVRLEWNGQLTAYQLDQSSYQPIWIPAARLLQPCGLPLHCGTYGACTEDGECFCLEASGNPSPSLVSMNASGSTHGCDIGQPLNTCDNNAADHAFQNSLVSMQEFHGLDYFSNQFSPPVTDVTTENSCANQCLHNCSCLAGFWHVHDQACFHVNEQLGSLQVFSNATESYRAYLKVKTNPQSSKYSMIAVSIGLASFLILCCLLYVIYRGLYGFDTDDDDSVLDGIPGLPTRFSYKDLQAATNGFAKKLGQGGSGAVYAGTLTNGTKVAVKQLQGSSHGGREFGSEVAIMGGIHHYHLLSLLGFCAQGKHRLLVSEYMENGSLDQWLFGEPGVRTPLPWDLRCRIALGAARGLSYLHNECREKIIHMDVKPQNILLDQNFEAKVADFGISRFIERDKCQVLTTMKGTPGYLAPEWVKEGPVDEKCDVFSFGKVLMEIISGRRNLDHTVELKEQIYYPEWAFWQAQKGNFSELTNAKLGSEEDELQLQIMIKTAFLCVLENPALRPSMRKVVKMLEGDFRVSGTVLSSLHQGLLFVLRNPSILAERQMEETMVSVLDSSNESENTPNLTQRSPSKSL